MANEAVTPAHFASLMAALPQPVPPRLALAVSGGPDSMALAWLTQRWAAAQSPPPVLQAFIVDHALRPAASAEAATTAERLGRLGLPAQILRWEHPPVTGRLQAGARAARYRLLAAACRAGDMTHLLLAHQAEDQAETILMRLAKGSGVNGLAGMATASIYDGLTLWRPLLGVRKDRLTATCRAAGIAYATDPGNQSPRFARGRLRQVMPLLAAEGLTLDRLLDLGARAGDAKQALDHYTQALAATAVTLDAVGAIHIRLDAFSAAPRAIAQRLLGLALRAIQPSDYGTGHAALAAITTALTEDTAMPARTLHGCLITQQAKHATVMREVAAIADAPVLAAGASLCWDNRWDISRLAADTGPALQVRPLGHPPHDVLDRLAPGLRQRIPQGRIRAGLPGLWHGAELAQIPALATTGLLTARLLTNWPILP